jgi:hypothetical protein
MIKAFPRETGNNSINQQIISLILITILIIQKPFGEMRNLSISLYPKEKEA